MENFETKVMKISKLLKNYPNRSKDEFMKDLKNMEKKGLVEIENDKIYLTKTGMGIARCVGFEIAEYDKDVA